MFIILSAARTGIALFSTTILSLVDTRAIVRAQFSTYVKSAARPYKLYYNSKFNFNTIIFVDYLFILYSKNVLVKVKKGSHQ